ncbi:hypothetical protein [Methylotuvimicrobium sp.]|uniref:hypothetical protein n=1 Tax=Methylotuvimicrobium sp. TaxID=2822413 RepID=UPI003D655B0B
MSTENINRIDEVSRYYSPAAKLVLIGASLFWINASLSLSILFSEILPSLLQSLIPSVFIASVLIQFVVSQINRFYLIPKAERIRREQMLSDAFGAHLSHDKTSLYYNNDYSPSVKRLGANTMENSLFSSEVAAKMLVSKRLLVGIYLVVWVLVFSSRDIDLDVIIWITQIVFSGEIIVQWLNLEVLRFRQERTYEKLHAHFLHDIGDDSQRAIATILDSFVAYEVAKSSASYLLSTKVFNELNPELTKKWEQVRSELKMNF